MKFFTREWATGGLNDTEWEKRSTDYEAHLEAIFPEFPTDLQSAVEEIKIHDGLIEKAQVSPSCGSLSLTLVVGDLQEGYFSMTLNYSGVDITSLDSESLQRIAESEETEVLYWEWHKCGDSKFEHRLLFEPDGQLTIAFENLRVTKSSIQNRERGPGPRFEWVE